MKTLRINAEPETGRLNQSAPRLSVVDPGFLLATINVGAEVAAEA